MPYIKLPESVPGMRSLLTAYSDTGQHLSAFAQQLLRGASSLSGAERELIAAKVSQVNHCKYCMHSHAQTARHLFSDDDNKIVEEVIFRNNDEALSEKMQTLIKIALAVQQSGLSVEQSHIDKARNAGADDKAIHDTVLISAAFCMFNRYVDGLATLTPDEPEDYVMMGKRLAESGYLK
ncbi:MAG: peroxidase-related enzyme [Calditrichaceae bacterium]|nr:peroxidase-related enzyme [Calditrichaceae bacterium]